MQEINIQSPIFSLYVFGSNLLVGCGGGNKKCGIKNKILLFQLNDGSFGEKLIEEDFDDIPDCIDGIPKKKIFCFCSTNQVIFFKISFETKKFPKIYTLKLDSDENLINCLKLNDDLLATGEESGALNLFKINYSNDGIASIKKIASNVNAHYRDINKIIFGEKNKIKFLITSSHDGKCKIFDINNLKPDIVSPIKIVSFFSFRKTYLEPANYIIRDMIYIKESNLVYTIQSKKKGESYMTKWDISNINLVKPIETIKISDNPSTSFDINQKKNFVGISEYNGNIIFVDLNNMDITGRKKIGEEAIKICKFHNNFLITGSIAHWLKINREIKGWKFQLFRFIFYLIIFFGICYYIYLKKNNLINEK